MNDRQRGIAEDRRLVQRAQRGDRAAFGDLVRKYTGVVRSLVSVRVGWGAQADDAVQDVFLLAFRRLGTLSEPERFAGWISRVAINRAREMVRREAPRRAASLHDVHVEPAADSGPDRAEVEDEVLRMRAAMTTLDDTTQLILSLRYQEGLAVKDIADRIGAQPPAVSMRLTRGLRRLRELLAGTEDDA